MQSVSTKSLSWSVLPLPSFTMSCVSVLLLCCLHLSLSTIPYKNQVLAWPLRVSAGTQVRPNSNSNLRIVTKCFPGMFLKIDCKMYFDCSSEGHFRRNFCSSGTYWNHRDKKCDEIQNVPECVAVYSTNPENRGKAVQQQPLISSTTSPSTERASSTFKTMLRLLTASTTESVFVSSKGSKEKSFTSTTQSTVLAATPQTRNQLKGEDDDYIDPPNVDWDIDGVLGLESGRGISEISEKTGNDIITEDAKQSKDVIKKNNPLEINKEGSQTTVLQVPTSSETQGKICVLRGKEKVCSPAVNSIPVVYTNQIFSQQTSSTVPPLLDVTQSSTANQNTTSKNSGEKVSSNNPISFNITIHLNVQESAIRFVRIIAYYVNLTIINWKSTWLAAIEKT